MFSYNSLKRFIFYALFFVGIITFFSLGGAEHTLAQGDPAFVRLVRAFELDEMNISNPAGLAFTPWANTFHVVEARPPGQPLLDVTEVVKPQAVNRLAVRVLNPTNEPIDGILLRDTAHTVKKVPWNPGSMLNFGGITDSVELIAAPAVRARPASTSRPSPDGAGIGEADERRTA